MRYIDPDGHKVCDGESETECETDESIFEDWETILLATAIFSESSNGTYPKGMTMIGWVYLNRVASGIYSSITRAVGPGQSALISALQDDFPWLLDLLSLSSTTLKEKLSQMNTSMLGGDNRYGWEKAVNAAKSVVLNFDVFGKKADPTHGATDFRAAKLDEFDNYVRAYEARKNNPTDFPQFDYSYIGPFYGGPVLGYDLYLFFNNISYVSVLNPTFRTPG